MSPTSCSKIHACGWQDVHSLYNDMIVCLLKEPFVPGCKYSL